MEVSEHDRAQHARQRRFLIIMSIVLLAKYALAIELGNKLQLLGMEFDIQRKDALVVAGWIMWGWALVRLMQYHRSVARPNIFRALALETHQAAIKYLWRDAKAHIREGKPIGGHVFDDAKVVDMHLPERTPKTLNEPGWYLDLDTDYRTNPDGSRSYRSVTAKLLLKNGGEFDLDMKPEVSGPRMQRARAWGWLRVIVRTPVISDYYAPFIIAALPVIAAVLHYADRIP